MTSAFRDRDAGEVDALITDRYLDALLSGREAGGALGTGGTPTTDPARATADRLARALPRLHPSFHFEEALAARLAEVAVRMRLPLAAGSEGTVVPWPLGDPFDRAAAVDPVDVRDRRDRRPLLIGGALTSAAVSIAGAAYVAWRLNRPASPMVRAARAVARSRPA